MVSLLLTHWRYHSLALNQQYINWLYTLPEQLWADKYKTVMQQLQKGPHKEGASKWLGKGHPQTGLVGLLGGLDHLGRCGIPARLQRDLLVWLGALVLRYTPGKHKYSILFKLNYLLLINSSLSFLFHAKKAYMLLIAQCTYVISKELGN